MQSRFDEMTKVVASGLSRREAFRRLLGIAAGALFANLGLSGAAQAQGPAATNGPCCPRLRACFLPPDPNNPNGQKVCCPPGTICVPATPPPAQFGECCPKASVIFTTNAAGQNVPTGCCPTGLVYDPSSGQCVCPSGSTLINGACCPNGSVCLAVLGTPPICCPTGTVCLPVPGTNTRTCCPQGQVCSGAAGNKICCPAGTVCVHGSCQKCPTGTFFVNGACCPAANTCPPPTIGNPSLCCASGTICVSVAGAPPQCCPKAQTVFVNNTAVGCCPAGLVFDPSSPTLCSCPSGTTPCASSTGQLTCCPAGSFCVPGTTGTLVCCPKAQTVFSSAGPVGCCPNGMVFNPNSPTLCGCPPGTTLTQNGICCAKKDVCQPIPGVPPICCSGNSKCTTVINSAGQLVPTCVCPGNQHPCPTPSGVVCCHPKAVCV